MQSRTRIAYAGAILFLITFSWDVAIYFQAKREVKKENLKHAISLSTSIVQLNSASILNSYTVGSKLEPPSYTQLHGLLSDIKETTHSTYMAFLKNSAHILTLGELSAGRLPETVEFKDSFSPDKYEIDFLVDNLIFPKLSKVMSANIAFNVVILAIFILIMIFLFKRDFEQIQMVLSTFQSDIPRKVGKHVSSEVANICNELLFLKEREISVGKTIHDVKQVLNQIKSSQSTGQSFSKDALQDLIGLTDEALKKTIGIFKTSLQDVSISNSLQMTVNELRPVLEKKGITLSSSTFTGTTSKLDDKKFRLVMGHLIDNSMKAIKAPNSVISISLEVNDRSNIIRVLDNGVGVQQGQEESIFKPKGTTSSQGHGFGLSTCREYIQSFGGTLVCEPTGGKGALFIITLPRVIELDCVFVDDEFSDSESVLYESIHKKAKASSKNILTFSSVNELKGKVWSIPFDCEIRIDSRLEGDVRGEDAARELYELGFKNLLVTSNGAVNLVGKHWIKRAESDPNWF